MREQLLAEAREQAERFGPEFRAAALMRIARVQTVLAPAEARGTFEEGWKAASGLNGMEREFFVHQSRLLAAAVGPELLREIPAGPVSHFRSWEADALPGVMIEHGHLDNAESFVLGYDDASGFPFGGLSKVMARLTDEGRKLNLMRRAVEAWRQGPRSQFHFLWIFEAFWNILPAGEALAVAREIVRSTHEEPDYPMSGQYGDVRFEGGHENTLFRILHILRRLDPELAESLMADHSQLAAAARRYPNGTESIREEAEARRREAGQCAPGSGFIMAGGRDDFGYLRALMQAGKNGDFSPAIDYALQKLREDNAQENPNRVPVEFWPSTSRFRSILHRAGARLGDSAAVYLDRIPHPEVRLFAQIELAASLAGLPELQGTQREYRPPRRRASAVAEPEQTVDTGSEVPGIRCPKCGWRPRASDRWSCSCGHSWNTFDTGGVCPKCMRQWTETQCLECGEWSPHSDWYTHREVV